MDVLYQVKANQGRNNGLAGSWPTPQTLKHAYFASVMAFSLDEERMDLWGEYDMVTDIEFINIILPALARGAQWRTLDLRRSGITIASIQALCNSKIMCNPDSKLKELCLGNISLGDDGVQLLMESLAESPNIQGLSLFDNAISDKGANVVATILPSTNLRSLNLSNNFITDSGVAALAKAASRSKLERLILNVNDISDQGVQNMILAIPRSNLSFVGLRGNDLISDETKSQITRMIDIAHSKWYQTTITLLSARYHARIGAQSRLQLLPVELIRMACMMLQDDALPQVTAEASAPASQSVEEVPRLMSSTVEDEDVLDDEESAELDDDDDDDTSLTIEDKEEIAGFKEDALASLAHDRRKNLFICRLQLLQNLGPRKLAMKSTGQNYAPVPIHSVGCNCCA